MVNKTFLTKNKPGLRWKLTLSYTAVTVGALITVEIILLVVVSILVFALVNSGALPAQLIESTTTNYTPTLRAYLSQTPPDVDGLSTSLEQLRSTFGYIPLSFDATELLFVVAPDGELLAAQPAEYFDNGQFGNPLDAQLVPGLAEPLKAALAGEEDPYELFTLDNPDDQVVLAFPIWDTDHEQVLGVLVGLANFPTISSIQSEALPVIGVSLLLLILVAGLIGTVFGYLAARGPVRRLKNLSVATQAWSRGEFKEYVDDEEGDELGELAQRLNHMAQDLEQLLETRRELAVVEERNRLARELHDSAKQQAFAAAAQISGIRALIKRDPAAAEAHLIEAEHIIDRLRQELTSLIFEYRPAALDGRGLGPALEVYAAEWSRQNNIGYELRLQHERSVPLEIEQALFRIVQEALANVARHSLARKVEIILSFKPDHLVLTISDDGQGFNPKRETTGFGLRSIMQRAESLKGNLNIDAAPRHGTTLTCHVPIPPDSDRNNEEEARG